MDVPPRKRRFWQFHLSTAIVLMFIVGAYVFANSYRQALRSFIDFHEVVEFDESSRPILYGWPANFLVQMHERYNVNGTAVGSGDRVSHLIWMGLAIDIGVLAALVGLTAIGCEWFIRRREAGKR
jgi:hypothetical protein